MKKGKVNFIIFAFLIHVYFISVVRTSSSKLGKHMMQNLQIKSSNYKRLLRQKSQMKQLKKAIFKHFAKIDKELK